MSSQIIKELGNKLFISPDLCNWLQTYSALTWTKIGFARNSNLKISETTITQDLVFNFWLMAQTSLTPIEIYESKDEKTNGNDLEIIIQTNRGFVLMPCQAKIIQKENRYSTISHKAGGIHEQIDLLMNYGKKVGGLSVYLLYNFCDTSWVTEEIERKSGNSITNYGCTLAQAKYIKQNHWNKKYRMGKYVWSIPNFYDLHKQHAIPFQNIICFRNHLNWFTSLDDQSNELNFYNREEIDNDSNWQDLSTPRIGYIPGQRKDFREINDGINSEGFNPQFRIVFSSERRRN